MVKRTRSDVNWGKKEEKELVMGKNEERCSSMKENRNVSSDRQSCDFAYITKLTGNIPLVSILLMFLVLPVYSFLIDHVLCFEKFALDFHSFSLSSSLGQFC